MLYWYIFIPITATIRRMAWIETIFDICDRRWPLCSVTCAIHLDEHEADL